MPPVSQRIDNLLGGVSQQPAVLRLPSQGAEQINALDTPRGKRKRPPSSHVAKLSGDPTGYSGAFVHDLYVSPEEQYRIIVADGDLRVFNLLTGEEQAVQFAVGGESYLNGGGFRALSIGKNTIIVNRGMVVEQASDLAPVPAPEALVVVRSANFATTYTVTAGGTSASVTTAAEAAGASPPTTQGVASDLYMALLDTLGSSWVVGLYGSGVYLRRVDGADFTVFASDGSDNNSLYIVKGSVPEFSDLPDYAPDGFTVEVSGSPATVKDNYWMRFSGVGSGLWGECVKPGALTSLDSSTLPHVLSLGGSLVADITCSVPPADPWVLPTPLLGSPTTRWDLFVSEDPYPPQYTLSVMISGAGTASFSSGASGCTGAEMAAGLRSEIDALAGVTATLAGALNVRITSETSGGAVGATTASGSWALANTAFCPDSSLAPGAYVGFTVTNATDGSTGTITANGAHTITAVLSGGTTNTFSDGDSISIQPAGTTFVFAPAAWESRKVGDTKTCPWPSFLGQKIQEVFFTQDRVGFAIGGGIILSATGEHFNFFRHTVTDLLATDYIDIASAFPDTTDFHSVVQWNEGIYLFTSRGQFLLGGDPVLSPTTVSLDKVSSYENSPQVRPLAAGGRLFLSRERSGATEVLEYLNTRDYPASAEDVTEHVPLYVEGSPRCLAGDPALGFLAVLSDGDPSALYIYSYILRSSGERVLSSWGRWEFSADTEILYAVVSSGILGLVCKRPDGVYLESLDLTVLDTVYLDRQGSFGAGTFSGGSTTWTLPYSVAVDGSQGEVVVVRQDTGEEIPSTRPASTQVRGSGDYSGVPVTVGIRYEWRYVPTPIMLRDPQTGRPVTQGRLTLSYIDIGYANTDGLSVDVALQGREVKTLAIPATDESGRSHRLPVHGKSTEVSLAFHSSTAGPCTLLGMEWEGTYTTRNKRV